MTTQVSAGSLASRRWLWVLAALAVVVAVLAFQRGRGEESIHWLHDLPTGLKQARGTGKPVLLEFSADWCGPCQDLKYDILPEPRLSGLIQTRFIPVRIDVTDDAAANAPPASDYALVGYPTMIVTDATGKEISRFEGCGSVQNYLNWLGPLSEKRTAATESAAK